MALRIRGEEVTIQVMVAGNPQTGSFAKVLDFKLTPEEDLASVGFLGETEDQVDRQHHGYAFSFATHEMDNNAVKVLLDLVANEQQGQPFPDVVLILIKKYRDPSIPPATLSLQQCVLKLDGQEFSSRKDYVKNSWSGKCRIMKSL